MKSKRNFIQARNLLLEAKSQIQEYYNILRKVREKYEKLRKTNIYCKAFTEDHSPKIILVTRQCWNHVFRHTQKRRSNLRKLERALCFDLAVKLMKKSTTYQEVSIEKDKGNNKYLTYGIIGYIEGARVKVVIKKNESKEGFKLILYSFYQLSS